MSIEQKLLDLTALAGQVNEDNKEDNIKRKTNDTKTDDDSDDTNDKSDIEMDDMQDDDKDTDMADGVDGDDEKADKDNAMFMKGRKGEKKIINPKNEQVTEKIDLGKLFEGQDLSEEFKDTATEIFESAVAARVKQELDARLVDLEESFDDAASESALELEESLVDKVDGYLDLVVEQWMEKNELAITRGIKTEILESFVSGMKEVFESHYIDVPDEKYDLVEAAQLEVQELEEKLDEAVANNIELSQALKEVNRYVQIEEACEGLASTDAEKFRALAEELSYSESNFEAKLQNIKESYFLGKKAVTKKTLTEDFMTDTPVDSLDESTMNPTMRSYLAALERNRS